MDNFYELGLLMFCVAILQNNAMQGGGKFIHVVSNQYNLVGIPVPVQCTRSVGFCWIAFVEFCW
jgi:hypothetical protein